MTQQKCTRAYGNTIYHIKTMWMDVKIWRGQSLHWWLNLTMVAKIKKSKIWRELILSSLFDGWIWRSIRVHTSPKYSSPSVLNFLCYQMQSIVLLGQLRHLLMACQGDKHRTWHFGPVSFSCGRCVTLGSPRKTPEQSLQPRTAGNNRNL